MAPMISTPKNNLDEFQIDDNILQKERRRLVKLRNFIEKFSICW